MRGTPRAQLLGSKYRSPLKRNQGFAGKRLSQGLGQGKMPNEPAWKISCWQEVRSTEEMTGTSRESREPTQGAAQPSTLKRMGRGEDEGQMSASSQGLPTRCWSQRDGPVTGTWWAQLSRRIEVNVPGPWRDALRRTQPPVLCHSCQNSRLQSNPEKTTDKSKLGNVPQSD